MSQFIPQNALMAAEMAVLDMLEARSAKERLYTHYIEDLDTALADFEKAQEWADLITSLQKLQRVLESRRYAQYRFIPRTKVVTVTKALAQCLNKGLPSGVHARTLAIYSSLLVKLHPDFFLRDLSLYCTGILPLLPAASEAIRLAILDLLSAHFIPLGARLTPALPGVVAAVLPGLEESGGLARRTREVLQGLRQAAGIIPFVTAVWQGAACTPSLRLSAFVCLGWMLPKPAFQHSGATPLTSPTTTAAAAATASAAPAPAPAAAGSAGAGRWTGELPLPLQALAVRTLTAAIADKASVLVRRQALDLVVSHFPLRPPLPAPAAPATAATSATASAAGAGAGAGEVAGAPSASPATAVSSTSTSASASASTESAEAEAEQSLSRPLSPVGQAALAAAALAALTDGDVSLSRRVFFWLLTPPPPTPGGSGAGAGAAGAGAGAAGGVAPSPLASPSAAASAAAAAASPGTGGHNESTSITSPSAPLPALTLDPFTTDIVINAIDRPADAPELEEMTGKRHYQPAEIHAAGGFH